MKRAIRRIPLIAGAGLLVLSLAAAQRPALLARASGGQWELSGLPGATEPVRTCLRDLAPLTHYEHRGKSCSPAVIRDGPALAEVHYTCTGGGFGRTTIGMLTPRSLRVETQGISDNAPFHYVIQARRVGDCPVH